MSYLHPVRLHFAGRFRADVSTVNNSLVHYTDGNFDPIFQKPLSGGNDRSNWQPAGTGAWRLLDCEVTRACRADGTAATTPSEDAVVGSAVREAGDRPSAKIVDLDPQQQGVSMIFGLTVRVLDQQGHLLVQGDFEPAAFFDLRSNRLVGAAGIPLSAYFHSILKNVEWGDVTKSPCLLDLKTGSAAGKLSIRFMTDGYQTSLPQRGYGRIVGTIGPFIEGEPRTFVAGRHLRVKTADTPQAEFAYADCSVDVTRRKILVDVGNVLQVDANGDFTDMGELTLAVGTDAAPQVLGQLNYFGPGKYRASAGVYEIPESRTLTDAELDAVRQSPLRLTLRPSGAAAPVPFAQESADGMYLRAEQFVFRMDPGAKESTDLFATLFGAPLVGATPQVQVFPFSLAERSPLPDVTVEEKTGTDGRARLTIEAVDPTNPRGAIDGQIYALLCVLQESQADPNEVLNAESNFVSLLMFDPATVLSSPGWNKVQPIFKQYADLYPRPHGPDPYAPFDELPPSRPVVNLNDYDSVARFAPRLLKALDLPVDHPNHMPVTRDLSAAKRTLLLNWLRNVGTDGKPKLSGSPQAEMAPAARASRPARYAAKSEVQIERLRHKP